VTKILVADDNSNIQKMVGLALKDQGIDVVAVGNGEAAVRKLADVRPDLILADVFMPVRNGYEVCEYVKADRTLSHIPVILLVGAFDPLDEQEAQRVGADGVLKKPFVPPDPLISMVKSALARAGASTAGQPAAETAPSSRDLPAPVLATVPAAHAEEPAETLAPSFSSSGQRTVSIPEGAQPVAFGNLLRTPAPAAQEESEGEASASYLVDRHPNLDEGRSWNATGTQEATEQDEEEEESSTGWRREADELEDRIPAGGHRDWQDAAFSAKENAESAKVKEATDSPVGEHVASSTPAIEGTSPGTSWQASAPTTEAPRTPPGASGGPEISAQHETPAESIPNDTPVSAPAESRPGGGASWYSVSSTPWDTEAAKASRTADPWNVAPPAVKEATPPAPVEESHVEPSPASPASEPPVPTSAEIAQSVVERTLLEAQAQPAQESAAIAAASQEPAAAPEGAPAPDMEALVKKVLEKMSPDMLQNMTRELLKPMVEAIVRGELESKK